MTGAVLELQTAEACNLFSVTAGDGNDNVYIVPTLRVDADITVGKGNDNIHHVG